MADTLNLNTATPAELETLPGVDHRLARRIVRYRQINGLLTDPADLLGVKGIDPALVKRIRARVTVENPVAFHAGAFGPLTFSAQGVDAAIQPAERITFYGTTDHLVGEISLVNQGTFQAAAVPIRVENTQLFDASGTPIDQIQIRQRIPPGTAQRVPLTLQLDSRTPPGTHQAELVLGGQRQMVTFQVAEKVNLEITPAEMILTVDPGGTVQKTVFVSNRGNVAVHIDTIGAVGLQEANLVCRALRAALQNTQEDDFDRVLDEVVGKLRAAYSDSGAVALRVRNDPLDLAPGQTAALNLSMTMPTAMRPTRRYTGAISLFNASINILVQPLTTETQGG